MKTPTRSHSATPDVFRSGWWVLVLVVAFAVPAVSIDFFHVEHDCLANDDCPACQLHRSAAATGTVAAPEVPVPAYGFSLRVSAQAVFAVVIDISAASRSPPSA